MAPQYLFPWFRYVKWQTVLLWRDSDWCCVPQHASRIHCSRSSSAVWRWGHVVSTRRGTSTLQLDVRTYLDNTFSDRWIGRRGSVEYPPTIARFNPTWLFLVRFLEGRGVQHQASNTSSAPAGNWTVLRSRPSSKFDGHLSVSYSPLLTVPRS
jgi:hypothetical protein